MKKYKAPELEVIRLDTKDIIKTSGLQIGNGDLTGEGGDINFG